jgi:hypothetical protein
VAREAEYRPAMPALGPEIIHRTEAQILDGEADGHEAAGHQRLAAAVLGGPNHFAIYYAGPKGAKPLAPLYNTGNVVNNLMLNELDCNDGFSWSFQENSTISNVTHTGSRLALYVDQSTTVTDYNYTPGAQQCGARNGFWITPPADNITITDFTSSGEVARWGSSGRVALARWRKTSPSPVSP